MRHSIRYRFTLIFIGLMAAMLLAIWVTNNWFLQSYYINQKVKVLEEAYARIDSSAEERLNDGENIVDVIAEEMKRQRESDERMNWNRVSPGKNNPPETETAGESEEESSKAAGGGAETAILRTIRRLSEKNNVGIVMIDSDSGNAIFSSTREGDWLAMKVQRYTLGHNVGTTKLLKIHKNYTIVKAYDPRSGSYFLESWGFFSDNRTLYIMSMPLASIQDSVALSNRFLSYVGLVALLIGCVLMYVTTRRVTLPILRLSALSEEMSKLNFEAKYEGTAEDEIGILGHSMNTLSDKLKDTIGELKHANIELQRDIEEKIQIDEIRKEFIANVSHELKTPIALIQGYAEGLIEGMCNDEESRNYYCEVIMDEANKMNKMVRQLLNLTALEFGNDTPELERFDVVEVIRQLTQSENILIQQNEAKVVIEAPETCFVWADEFKIEEVLINYLNNAMNHLDGERLIRIRVEPREDEVEISVFNTGKPVPEEDLPNLWTKFYKVDKARTREYGGSGIGLSIVKAIVEAHHKDYGVNNRPDGVEFWFTLELAGGSGDAEDDKDNP